MTQNHAVGNGAQIHRSSAAVIGDMAQPLPYPIGIYRVLMRLPVWLYRLGLGRLVNLISIMVLTTRGRISGLPRHTPIEYRIHGRKIYVISAWGTRPHWFQNLQADPIVTLRLGGHVFAAQARGVSNTGEALRVLYLFRKRAPAFYDALIARLSEQERITTRTLPDVSDRFTIVRFDPLETEPALPTVPSDWRWIWGGLGLAGGVLLLWAIIRRSGYRA